MRSIKLGMVFTALFAVTTLAMPAPADALFRLGVDFRWVPLAVESMDDDGMSLSSHRQLESIGLGARFLIGVDRFSLGPKLNFSRHAFADDRLDFSQLDANAHVRMRMPASRFAVFVEGGPSISLDIGGVGYNAAAGLEVDLLGWPLVDLNLGLAAQYARVPIGIGAGQKRVNEGVRAMVILGFDFAL